MKKIHLILILFFLFSCEKKEVNIVGKYKFSSSDIPINETFKKQILELKPDKSYNFKNANSLNMCDNGLYEVDYKFEYNEISFECGNNFRMAHIENGFWNTKIVFQINSEDEIIFKKID